MNKSLLTVLAIFFLKFTHAQDVTYENTPRYADSLKRTVQANNDKSALLALCYYYIEGDNDSCLSYATQLHDLSLKDNSKLFEAYGLFFLGVAQEKRGNTANDLQFALKALSIFQDLNDSIGIALGYWRLAVIYKGHKENSKVLDYFKKSLYVIPQNPSNNNPSWENSLSAKYRIYWILSGFYLDNNQPDSCLICARICEKLTRDIPDKRYYSSVLKVVASYYKEQKNYPLAIQYLHHSTDIAIRYGHTTQACENYLILANILYETANGFDSSVYYAQKADSLAQKIKNYEFTYNVATFLTKLFKQKNQIDRAFKYQEVALSAKDSLFNPRKNKELEDVLFKEQLSQVQIREAEARMQNRIKLYVLLAGLVVFSLIAFILYRSNRHKQKAYTLLQKQKQEIDVQKEKTERTLDELRTTQAQLIQSEKMASLGELTAGIAHEIQNPLNFVNNFSEVNTELVDELKSELATGNVQLANEIADDIKDNEQKINHHGKRADAIVKGMLQHSRTSSGQKEPTDINALCDEYLRLAYHGLRAKDKSFNAKFETHFDNAIGKINVVPQDIGRVLLNLINNAFYAVDEKRQHVDGTYVPCVSVITRKANDKIEVKVADNGNGIPQKVLNKIFQPFFTTKPTGQGTGLGLSLSYDTIKAHGGEIKVETKEGEGTEFVVLMPAQN